MSRCNELKKSETKTLEAFMYGCNELKRMVIITKYISLTEWRRYRNLIGYL